MKKLLGLVIIPILLSLFLVESCKNRPYYYRTSICQGRAMPLEYFERHKNFLGVIDLNNYRQINVKNAEMPGTYHITFKDPENPKDVEKHKIVSCIVDDKKIIEELHEDSRFAMFQLKERSVGAKLILHRMDLRKLDKEGIEYFKTPGSFRRPGEVNINNTKGEEEKLLRTLRTDMVLLLVPVNISYDTDH